MELISTIGAGGLAGLVVGLLLVAWVEPATVGGQLLLIVVCAGLGVIVSGIGGAIVALLSRRK